MLTRRASRLREYALFALAALAPALAVGVLALRALSNENAAALRETAAGLDAAGERLSLRVHQALSQSEKKLGAARLDRPAPELAHTLNALRPAFATAVVLGADRALLWPAPPRVAEHAAPPKCGALAATLADPTAKGRDAARRALLADCTELRTPTGRWLWPVVALDARSSADAVRIADWLERHAELLSNAQRDATRLALGRLPEPARSRALAALSHDSAARASLVDELGAAGPAKALAAAPDSAGVVTWHAGSTLGALRALGDGRLAGFVVDAASLQRALDQGALGAGPDTHVRVLDGAAEPPPSGHALPTRLSARVPLAPALTLGVVPADPDAVARHAARSRLLLLALALGSTLLAFGVAALLFARLRAARRSSELRTDFVSAVSHELRTPIASVRMFAELLEEERVEPDERREVVDAIARESRRLGETVERLLGFSRMAAGRAVIERQLGSVAAAVAASIDTFEQRHPGLAVERTLDRDVQAPIDAAQIGLAVDNLLENARKHAPDGTPYRVEVARDGRGVAIRVSDHGPGIAPRDQKRIFRPFERADDRLSRATEGSGIGLSLVRHVAGAHGGNASVDSRPGKGATFTLWIPGSET